MYIVNRITICLMVSLCLCSNRADGQGNYFQMLLQGLSKSQVPSSGNILSAAGSLFRNYQDEIIGYVGQTLTSGLESVSPNTTNNLCLNHTELFIKALLRRENWALRMVDAFGKPGTGILDYSVNWIGNYDECIAIQATAYQNPVAKEGPSTPYTGKYCTASFPFGPPTSMGQLALKLGLCVPDSCSKKDITGIVNAVTDLIPQNMTNIPLPTANVDCQEKSLEFTDKALAVTIVGGVFVALILIATAYDIIFQHCLSKAPENSHANKCYLKSFKGIENGAFDHPKAKESMENEQTEVVQTEKEKNGFTDVENTAIGRQNSPKPYKPGIPGNLLLSFSLYTNAPKILNTNQPKGTLTSVNGIRFLSMSWVILGHTIGFGIPHTSNASTLVPKLFKRFTFQAILNGTVSVDTFFVLSGLLVSYISSREMKKRGGALKFNWPMFYFHRYWRLTPPYMLLLMLYVPTYKYWGDGPAWPQNGIERNECEDTWWKNILYINNVYEAGGYNQCLAWGWYLANDMQFYVISPIMLVPLYYSSVAGGAVCLILILVNCIGSGLISSHYGFASNVLFEQDSVGIMTKMHFTPWTRIGPYVVGIFTGYLLYKTECKVKMSKLTNMMGWTVATAVAMSVLYGLYTPDGTPPDLSNAVSALYNATSRTAWGLSVAWVIFACATGYGGPVNALLSWRAIIPLSRLTYCAYLIHPIVLYSYNRSLRTLMYWNDLEMIYLFLGNICVSFAAAFVLSLAFESPMMGLEKVLLGRKKNS
ncbi:nose resistant to fluoxetine protein 6-like [Mercenaria mercenaria]|uniref:nose resistant to fluoxetine protein 6-like n=1 Tax=Mercenaria mercenaria TaxID=6596 RepID=UPI00234E49F2|nr:nose resistant to fluoxetine protein 6-like [Mercenaria mercenaria]